MDNLAEILQEWFYKTKYVEVNGYTDWSTGQSKWQVWLSDDAKPGRGTTLEEAVKDALEKKSFIQDYDNFLEAMGTKRFQSVTGNFSNVPKENDLGDFDRDQAND